MGSGAALLVFGLVVAAAVIFPPSFFGVAPTAPDPLFAGLIILGSWLIRYFVEQDRPPPDPTWSAIDDLFGDVLLIVALVVTVVGFIRRYRGEPHQLYLSRRIAVRTRLLRHGMTAEMADRWLAAWEREGVKLGFARLSTEWWDAGRRGSRSKRRHASLI